MIDKYEDEDKKNDKINAGKNTKTIYITDKINQSRVNLLDKYNLKIGQVFTSCTELSAYIGKSMKTVTEWMKKGWISNYI